MGSNLIHFLIERSSLLINTTRREENVQRSRQRFYDVNVFGKSKHSNYRAQLPKESATNTNKAAWIDCFKRSLRSLRIVEFSFAFCAAFLPHLTRDDDASESHVNSIMLISAFATIWWNSKGKSIVALSLALLERKSQLPSIITWSRCARLSLLNSALAMHKSS